ncbi:MAG: nucleotidyltransferase domain-containing protein [Betaproteobacteria bacterium]|nr:nucleotidyltransferase domain-containing protein [Betaproteobacteria bacterium]
MKTIPSELLEQAVERLKAEFQPEQIFLFGSHAWGTPHDDSDVDLMVIVRESDERATLVHLSCAAHSRVRVPDTEFGMDVGFLRAGRRARGAVAAQRGVLCACHHRVEVDSRVAWRTSGETWRVALIAFAEITEIPPAVISIPWRRISG